MKITFEKYHKSVITLCPKLSVAAWQYLESGLSMKVFNAKAFYIKAGEVQRSIGFVETGLIRGFYIDDNGNEITMRFSDETTYATHYSSFIAQTPSQYYFQCLEKTTLILLNYQHIQKGYEQFPSLERYGRLIAESVVNAQRSRIESFQFYNAEQRYLNFINHHPNLYNRISLTHLASYLGIERPSLSRIRRNLNRT